MEKDQQNKKELSSQVKQPKMIDLISKKTHCKNPRKSNKKNLIKDESLFTKNNSHLSSRNKRVRKKPLRWTESDTNTFYRCLEFFGVDFSMIRGVLSHKTKRQLLRKFHKEKKKNPELIDKALKLHESNLIEKNSQCQNFLEDLFNNTNNSFFSAENNSDDSLDDVVHKKLKLMLQPSKSTEFTEENKILPLDLIFEKFEI